MVLTLQALTDSLLSFLFPDRCAGCGQPGDLFCARCRATLRPYPPDRPLPLLDGAGVAFIFGGPLRDALHRLKYDGERRVARPLGALMAAHLAAHPLPADALVPVPLHAGRLAERGFNQSEELARPIAARLRVPLVPAGLQRLRDTGHQVQQADARARRENVRDAFAWQAPAPPPARILLIDDVLTTGATVGACAAALRAAGAREVRVLALARSRPGE